MMKQIIQTKKAQFVEIDFFLAILILAMGIIVITAPFINVREDIQADRLSYDAVTILSTMKLEGLEQDVRNDIKTQSETLGVQITNEDTINNIITKLIVEAEKSQKKEELMKLAKDITNESLKNIIPERYKYEVIIISGDETYQLIELEEKTSLASQSRTLLTGLQVGKPMTGYIANANLEEVKKTDAVYEFIGGFIGQGNLTFKINVPSNDIRSTTIEGLFNDKFEVHINNQFCKEISASSEIKETLCNTMIRKGENNITIKFKGEDIKKHYVSGGIIKIEYEVIQQQIREINQEITERKNIPGIDGIINIYDSFYVPGKLKRIRLVLNHDIEIFFSDSELSGQNDAELIMTIGNETIYADNTSGSQTFTKEFNEWNYDQTTIPYRLGFPDLTTIIREGGPTDIVLVTDLSGSMNWDTHSNTNYCTDRECRVELDKGFGENFTINITQSCPNINESDFPKLYRRIDVARCLNLEFINRTFHEVQDSRIGIVGYRSTVLSADYMPLTDISGMDSLWDYSMTMRADGNTCSSCGVAAATYMLEQNWEQDRKKIIVFMTDGVPNACFRYNSPEYGAETKPPFRAGSCSNTINHFIDWAEYAKNDLGIIFYSIGFRVPDLPIYIDPLIKASSGEDENSEYYFSAGDGEGLEKGYGGIIEQITIGAGYTEQVINVSIADFDIFSSKLHNSYIEYTYETIQDSSSTGKIKITKDHALTEECNQEVNLDIGRAIIGGGYITSYSGNIWTAIAEINNNEIFNVFKYAQPLGKLGDPFMLGIRRSILNQENTINLTLNDREQVQIRCNENNKLIYDLYYPATFSITDIKEKSEGCTWTVNGKQIKIPTNYNGNNQCTIQNYDSNDTMQALGYKIITALTHNNQLVIDLENSELVVSAEQIENIPYMWGPAIIGVSVWR